MPSFSTSDFIRVAECQNYLLLSPDVILLINCWTCVIHITYIQKTFCKKFRIRRNKVILFIYSKEAKINFNGVGNVN